MGIQIYIKRDSIKHLIEKEFTDEHKYCSCNYPQDEVNSYCPICGEKLLVDKEYLVHYKGIDKVFYSLNQHLVYHDANKWGSSRQVILDWLKQHNISEDNYYFA